MKLLNIPLLAILSMNTVYAQDQPIKLTAEDKQLEVTKDGNTTTVSKVTDSPMTNTVMLVKRSNGNPINNDESNQGIDTSDITDNLSQSDIAYINAVNSNEKKSSIESKIVNNEAITEAELKALRKMNPNY